MKVETELILINIANDTLELLGKIEGECLKFKYASFLTLMMLGLDY